MGDAVLKRDELYGRQALAFVTSEPLLFEDTILFEYSSRIDLSDPDPQWEVLREVVSAKTKRLSLALPSENELVVHLRMGDVKGFKLPEESFVDYINKVIASANTRFTRVTIVSAIHFGRTLLMNRTSRQQIRSAVENDRKKIRNIVDLIAETGLKARLYSHEDIDKDFCFLSSSEHLVLGNGHYSLCAAMISSADIFVPYWARNGVDVDIDFLLNAKVQSAQALT